MNLLINGKEQSFSELSSGASLAALIDNLKLTGDRVAVELNGDIVTRSEWAAASLKDGDKLEIVHFVGGGSL